MRSCIIKYTIINIVKSTSYNCNINLIKATLSAPRCFADRALIKLSYIFPAKQENSEAYTNIPAKTQVFYFISMSVCRSVANFVYGCLREL